MLGVADDRSAGSRSPRPSPNAGCRCPPRSSPCRTGSSPARAARWSAGSTASRTSRRAARAVQRRGRTAACPPCCPTPRRTPSWPIAARLGPYEYASLGTADEPGTVLLTVSGAAKRARRRGGAAGTPLRDVLEMCEVPDGAGHPGRRLPRQVDHRGGGAAGRVSRKGLASGRRRPRRRHHHPARRGHLPARRGRPGGPLPGRGVRRPVRAVQAGPARPGPRRRPGASPAAPRWRSSGPPPAT